MKILPILAFCSSFSIAGAQPPLRWLDFDQVPAPITAGTPGSVSAFQGSVPQGLVPYGIAGEPGFFLFYDPVNRPYSFTPDPIWRAMFRGIRERIAVETRAVGVPAQAGAEFDYYTAFFEAREKARAAREAAGERRERARADLARE